MNKKKLAITLGDFNGIGPEVTVKALNKLDIPGQNIVLIGSKSLLTGLNRDYEIIEIPFEKSMINTGKETKQAGEFSYQCLQKACEMANNDKVSAIVTAPVSKNALHLAGYNFSGQTEILEKNLADKEKNEKAEMLFVCKDFRVLLLTRHLPLKDVKITKELLTEKLQRIDSVLKQKFSVKSPSIALCSLNPHAGENTKGIDVTYPKPADTLFAKAAKAFLTGQKQPYDVYCACYHDQGLIPIKALAMNKTVNMTVGLKVIRTSPAHGTAYDIAGKNIADETSMTEAISQALSL